MQDKITEILHSICADQYGVDAVIDVQPTDEQFGDFATNVAMQLAGVMKRNPREIAQEIVTKLENMPEINQVGVAGPGFINITLTDSAIIDTIETMPRKPLEGMKVLVEYSDPNPFKPLHAGHLYTTLVGDVLARLIESAGAHVVRLNFGGDVGLHVAKSIWGILSEADPSNLNDAKALTLIESLEAETIHKKAEFLGTCYTKGNSAYEEGLHASEITSINKRVYQIHEENDHESAIAQVYWRCRKWSYEYFDTLYEQLGVHAFDRFIPESEVTQLGLQTVREQLERGVYEQSNGAVIFSGEQYGLHSRVFINSEGLPTYETKDVGLSLTKWRDYEFDESIIITANEQAQYMQVVIKSIAQFAPEPASRTKHLTHGVVKLSGGVKMSSRKGNIVTALEILEAARTAGNEKGTAQDESVVLAAVKYSFLKNRIGGDIVYDADESVALEGKSGPYLQYAHARANSILHKSEAAIVRPDSLDVHERRLARHLAGFTAVVERSSLELAPHLLCNYLFDVSQSFNKFYENSKVIGSEREQSRLWLVKKYAQTLKNGLELLGITAPEHM